MSVFWLQPQAWWGLAALAVPVAIHLLARRNSRRLPFPSLRFLRTTRLAAMRRRVISDWPLLIVRMLTLAVVVAALAAPVLVSDARRARWNQRVARAIIVPQAGTSVTPVVADEQRGSFASAVFTPPTVADGARAAAIWLARQAPAAREVVIAGDFREGDVHPADFAALDPEVGIRFLALPAADTHATAALVVTDAGDGTASTFDVFITATDRSTTARYARAAQRSSPPIAVKASSAEQPHADAVLRTVLREGIRFRPDTNRAVMIAFAGAPAVGPVAVPSMPWARETLERFPGAGGGESEGRLVILAPMPATDANAARFVARAAHLVFAEPFDGLEPGRISPSALASWSRPPGPSPQSAFPADEGDRRVLWSIVLMLLGVEQLLRRAHRPAAAAAAADLQEPRVA